MSPSSRQLVRSAVGLAALAPAIALVLLAVMMIRSGGFGGLLAGLLVLAIAAFLLFVALMATHAPVSIAWMLKRTDEEREARAGAGDNGGDHASSSDESSSGTNAH